MNQFEVDQSLLKAVSNNNVEKVQELLEQEANPNAFDPEYSITILHAAAREGNVEIIKQLINAGADLNKRSGTNKITPLLAAIYKGHLTAVRLLLEAHANPNKTGRFGITPMEAAAAEDRVDIGRELLKHNADLKSNNKEWREKLNISMLQ